MVFFFKQNIGGVLLIASFVLVMAEESETDYGPPNVDYTSTPITELPASVLPGLLYPRESESREVIYFIEL